MTTQNKAIQGEGSQTQGVYEKPYGTSGGDYTNLNSNDGDAQCLVFLWYGAAVWYHCYNMEDFSGGEITNVRLSTVVRSVDNTGDTLTNYCRIGGVNYYGAAEVLDTNYETVTTDWATNPATGLAWTTEGLNAAEFGFKYDNAGYNGGVVTYMVLTVTYTPKVGRSFGLIIG